MTVPVDFELLDLQFPVLPPQAKIYVAFSGGLDSTVLLHLLAARAPGRVHAVHVHHGLQASADAWAAHCAERCAGLRLPFSELRLVIEAEPGSGPEAAARQARYQALRSLMAPGDCLATAHHRDDQAETLLLRLLRGSGVRGLGGMRALSAFEPGSLWRPLLATPRSELLRYAEMQGLHWIEDPHNHDPRYARSWLRNDVLPRLQQHFPQAQRSLARAAQLAAEASELLDELAAADAALAGRGAALSVQSLLQMSAPRRHNLLRFWLRTQGFQTPPAEELRRIASELLAAAADAAPRLAWAGCELRRYRQQLFAMPPLLEPEAMWSASWNLGCRLELPSGCGWLEAERPPLRALSVRLPRAGESFKPAGSAHTRSLKNLFQEAGVPPWVRTRTPLVEAEGVIAAVAGLGGTEAWQALRAQAIGSLYWHHELSGAVSPLAL